MMERVSYAPDGTLLSGTFQDYLCPTAPELPQLDDRALRVAEPEHAARREGARATDAR